MSLKRELDRLFAYDDWANRAALGSLRAGEPKGALRRMAHIIGAQRIWFQRITEGPPAEVWPDLAPDACRAQLAEQRGRWQALLAATTEENLARKVSYVNTKGQKFTSTVGEILMHVALHGAYHRGQIASDVRAHGGEPAYTDYIHALREKVL